MLAHWYLLLMQAAAPAITPPAVELSSGGWVETHIDRAPQRRRRDDDDVLILMKLI